MEFKKKRILFTLLLGNRSDFSDPDQIIFQATGTAHLLAISGLHIGLISNSVFLFSCFLWKKLATKFLLEKIPAQQFAAIFSIIVAIIYATISGFNLPVIRALIMTLGYLVAILCKTFSWVKDFYFLAIILILILEPFNILTISFWLSFLTVGILLYSYNPNIKINYNITNFKARVLSAGLNLLQTNWLMLIGLIPINAWFFGKIYLISYIANFIAIPWMSFLILPWMFFGLLCSFINFSLSKNLILFADLNLSWLIKILRLLSYYNNYILIELGQIKFLIFCVSLIGSLWLLLPKGLINKYIAIICFLPLFCDPQERIRSGEAIVSVLDVGQGLAVVIRLQKHIILYDVGPNNGVITNYLRALKIQNIDQLIISHTDYDHIGSLAEVLDRHKIDNFFTNIQGYKILNLSAKLCASDHGWELDGVKFQFFGADLNLLKFKANINKLKNDNSCILKMIGNGYSMLYTGDITKNIEKRLIAKYAENLLADVLLIPHHGSNSSSSEEFIHAVNPKYAIVSAGYLNKYHHPRIEVISKYLARGIKIFNNIEHGSIEVKFQPATLIETSNLNNIQIGSYKENNHKFWNY